MPRLPVVARWGGIDPSRADELWTAGQFAREDSWSRFPTLFPLPSGESLTYWSRTSKFDEKTRTSRLVEHTESIEAEPATWRAFRRQLDDANVWDWEWSYVNSNMADGTQWHLRVRYSDRSVYSGGSNKYPPRDEFDAFCAAISRLAGNRPFK
jgi:hypothetical protein